jgi:hypothetical protein
VPVGVSVTVILSVILQNVSLLCVGLLNVVAPLVGNVTLSITTFSTQNFYSKISIDALSILHTQHNNITYQALVCSVSSLIDVVMLHVIMLNVLWPPPLQPIVLKKFLEKEKPSSTDSRGLYHKTYYGRNLRISVIS